MILQQRDDGGGLCITPASHSLVILANRLSRASQSLSHVALSLGCRDDLPAPECLIFTKMKAGQEKKNILKIKKCTLTPDRCDLKTLLCPLVHPGQRLHFLARCPRASRSGQGSLLTSRTLLVTLSPLTETSVPKGPALLLCVPAHLSARDGLWDLPNEAFKAQYTRQHPVLLCDTFPDSPGGINTFFLASFIPRKASTTPKPFRALIRGPVSPGRLPAPR